jgi:hypothetical protein
MKRTPDPWQRFLRESKGTRRRMRQLREAREVAERIVTASGTPPEDAGKLVRAAVMKVPS